MIRFSTSFSWPWLISAGVGATLLLGLSYYFAVGRAQWSLRSILLALRWLAIAALLVCLLDPQRIEEIPQEQNARIAILLDTSSSMAMKDVPGTRLDSAKAWLHDQLLPSCPKGMVPSYYTFNQSLAPLVGLDSASATGGVTALANSLQHLLALPADQPLAGVVLCSDGIENTSGDVLSAARLFRNKGIPIHTATFGSAQEPRDIVLDNVQIKREIQDQAPAHVTATLHAPGFTNVAVPLQIRRGSKVLATQVVRLTGGPQRVEMDFTPREKGFQVYDLSIPSQPGEWLASNNRRAFGFESVNPTIRVLYMEGTPQQPGAPIPEWKYLKDALQSDHHIKVKVLYQPASHRTSGGANTRAATTDPDTDEKIYPVNHPTRGFPRSMAELLNYDVIIHSDIKKSSFSEEQLQNMARFVEEYGGGFVMIGGNSAFGKGGYEKTIVDRIIPVAMKQYADSAKLAFQMQVPIKAFAHPLMAIGQTLEESRKIWTEKFPRFYGFNRVDRPKPGAIILGETPGSSPQGQARRVALAVQDIGKGRSMAFTSDITRSWGEDFETLWGERINPSLPLAEANCDARYYRTFWINAIRWLGGGKIGKTNNAVTLALAQSSSLTNQLTTAQVMVRDNQSHEIDGAEVSLLLSGAGTNITKTRMTFDRATRSYVGDLRPMTAGTYTVTATATLAGKPLGDDRQLLVCEAEDLEKLDIRARPDLMAQIARASGGKDLTTNLKNRATLASALNNIPPPVITYHHTPLWDKAIWLVGILSILTLEWVLRRQRGLA